MGMTTDEQFELIALIGELDSSLSNHPQLLQIVCNTTGEVETLNSCFLELRDTVEKVDVYFEMFEFIVKKFYTEDPSSLKSIFSPFLLAK